MDEIDRLLTEAGRRCRTAQQAPSRIDSSALVAESSRVGSTRSFAAGAVTAASVLAVALLAAASTLKIEIGPAGAVPETSSGADRSIAERRCDVTVPEPPFLAPPPHPTAPPAYYGSRWFGSKALWTMISRDGEIWDGNALPRDRNGLTQKTFWWSAEWPGPDVEPFPAITVLLTRLDNPGTATFGRGTHASADFGTAMLVGVRFPAPGCWQITARYRDATLSYVVWIRGA